jgi:hypothetical protein
MNELNTKHTVASLDFMEAGMSWSRKWPAFVLVMGLVLATPSASHAQAAAQAARIIYKVFLWGMLLYEGTSAATAKTVQEQNPGSEIRKEEILSFSNSKLFQDYERKHPESKKFKELKGRPDLVIVCPVFRQHGEHASADKLGCPP